MHTPLSNVLNNLGVPSVPHGVAIGTNWHLGKGKELVVRSPIDGQELVRLMMASRAQVDTTLVARREVCLDACPFPRHKLLIHICRETVTHILVFSIFSPQPSHTYPSPAAAVGRRNRR